MKTLKKQGHLLSEKAGKPRNVGDFTRSQGTVGGKILLWKVGQKRFIVSCIFHPYVYLAAYIMMKSL